MLNQSSPVAKTAFDSLQAKQSAVTVGYNPMMVVLNGERYEQLLGEATRDWKVRRQTPLVHAGYAARVLAISHAIQAFCQYHQHVQRAATQMIQLVFLGCGADVIGLWAHSFEDNCQIRIVELDTPEVCAVKRDLWLEREFVVPVEIDGEGEPIGLTGCIRTPDGSSVLSEPNYFLLPIDLRDITQMDGFLDQIIDSEAPTLVISELVLTYLPERKTDSLLGWCASKLLVNPESALVALEALGYGEFNSSARSISVLEGYKRDYGQKFGAKMARGKSDHKKDDQATSDESPFFPLGVSCQAIEDRMRRAGFATSYATTLGAAAAHTSNPNAFRIPEIFDEHAALCLHLQSYSIVSGIPKSSASQLLSRMMCPAKYAATELPPLLKYLPSGSSSIVYTVLDMVDEMAVRDLFLNTYANLFDDYPAIRKMVHAVLKREFAVSASDRQESEITTKYKYQGGCFFVAIRYDQGVESKIRRDVVGCIGVRTCETKHEEGNALEIFRLAVDERWRGQGIGRTLMQLAETFARSRCSPKLIANTLTLLEKAMLVYEAAGYVKEQDSPLGALTMRKYVKTLTTC